MFSKSGPPLQAGKYPPREPGALWSWPLKRETPHPTSSLGHPLPTGEERDLGAPGPDVGATRGVALGRGADAVKIFKNCPFHACNSLKIQERRFAKSKISQHRRLAPTSNPCDGAPRNSCPLPRGEGGGPAPPGEGSCRPARCTTAVPVPTTITAFSLGEKGRMRGLVHRHVTRRPRQSRA